MNPEIRRLFADYLLDSNNPLAAAMLVVADVLCRPTSEPIVIEPDDKGTLSVKEAAERLHTSSKKIYQMCLTGQLRCTRVVGHIRIPVEEIERL